MDLSILDRSKLVEVVGRHATMDDVAGDGVFDIEWRSTETFYRHTEDYVAPEKRIAYKMDLERTFPGRRGA